jgi:hypothetical protein
VALLPAELRVDEVIGEHARLSVGEAELPQRR